MCWINAQRPFAQNFRKLKMKDKTLFMAPGGKNILDFRLRSGNIELVCGMFSLCARKAKEHPFFLLHGSGPKIRNKSHFKRIIGHPLKPYHPPAEVIARSMGQHQSAGVWATPVVRLFVIGNAICQSH